MVLPGPAILFFIAGLAVLGTEYAVARRAQHWVVARALRLRSRRRTRGSRHQPPAQERSRADGMEPPWEPPR